MRKLEDFEGSCSVFADVTFFCKEQPQFIDSIWEVVHTKCIIGFSSTRKIIKFAYIFMKISIKTA